MPERPRIRVRLAWWYATSLLVVLLVTVGVLRALLGRALDDEFRRSQEATAQLATRFFRTEVAEYLTVEATLAHLAGELVPGAHVLEFVGPDRERWPRARAGGGATPHPSPPLAAPVVTLETPLDPALAPGWMVHVHTSAAQTLALRRRIDLGVAVAVLCVGVAAWWIGWVLAGRTLRPVGAMADSADAITAETTGRRLPVGNPDDELGRLGVRFNALLDRLDSAMTTQRRFLHDAAHELRTPIARMRHRVDVARLAMPTDETLDALDGDLRRTSTLITELLHLAHADAATGHAPLTSLFLDDLVSDEWRAWRGDAARAHVSLTLSQLDEAPVRGDATLLRRLVGVLVDNAIRYTPEGGAVDVRVVRAADEVMLVIDDTGIGVAPEELPRLTERFHRGANARARRPDGSGLGLAIAADIVARHGAALRFEQPASTGTRVVVVFPVFTVGSSARATLPEDASSTTLPEPATPLG
ncbi:MAG: HAMP domain-containing histidine kinase [Gemmatimonadaceae bacterium]|jgi:signal transduction histidine kinase|nr:HAMP domain-containing histidine kinase [Gemmatimonadaceae bacterium]